MKFILQLDLITDFLGTPTVSDMKYACKGARNHILKRPKKDPSLSKLYVLLSHSSSEAVHLLNEMLMFNPVS